MTPNSRLSARETVRVGMLAGLAGGLAEVLWIWIYGAMSGTDSGLVARGVSVAVGAGETVAPVAFGIVIHMTLAVVLGAALALALRPAFAHMRGNLGMYASLVLALVGVWAVNFFVILPWISPAFVELVPYQVSLLSKMLFGFAAASVLGTRSIEIAFTQERDIP